MGTLGSRSGARNERVLAPGFLERRWKPGQSGNPSGHAAEYGEVIRLARSLSIRAVERLGELMESEDERVAAVACSAVLDRAFGKPQTNRPEKEDSLAERLARMTPAERERDALELVERARRRIAEYRQTIEEPEPAVERARRRIAEYRQTIEEPEPAPVSAPRPESQE